MKTRTWLGIGLALPWVAAPAEMFEMREIDMHFHSGMERPVDLKTWIDLAVKDGRKIITLVDHLELYRKTPEEYRQWRTERKFEAEYPVGPKGHRALFTSFDEAAARRDVILLKGWEVSETELDTGIEEEALRMVDMIGWHISPGNGRKAPDGRHLIRRAKQVKEMQKRLGVPMVLFHPFTMRLENQQRTAKAAGRGKGTLRVEDYRFFQPGEQEELARVLRGTSVYIELALSTKAYFEDPVCKAALIADIKPLAEMGVRFSVSTDAHGLAEARAPFHPETYAAELGITKEHVNWLPRELLALRARRPAARP